MVPPPLIIPYTKFFLSLPITIIETLISNYLTLKILEIENDDDFTKGNITKFHARDKPALNLGVYIHRLMYYTPFPIDSLLLSIIYLNRITCLPSSPSPSSPSSTSSPLFPTSPPPPPSNSFPSLLPSSSPITPLLSSYTIHRLLLTNLLISTKFNSDYILPNITRISKVVGVGIKELNRLEGEGLGLLGWDLGWDRSGGEGEEGKESEIVCRVLLEGGERDGVELVREGLGRVREEVVESLRRKEEEEEGKDARGGGIRNHLLLNDEYLYEVTLCPTPPLPDVHDSEEDDEEDSEEEEESTSNSSNISIPAVVIKVVEERKGLKSTFTKDENVVKELGSLKVVDEVK